MSFRERIVEGMNSLFERLGEGDELGNMVPEDVERELAARKAAREKHPTKPHDNPLARLAGPGDKAKSKRAALAKERIGNIRSRRAATAAEAKRSKDDAFRRMAEEARRNPPPRTPPRSSSASSNFRDRARGAAASMFQDKALAEHYKTLEVEYGADMTVVKKAYRGLMRKYHPDLHSDPKKQKAATQLSVKISAAYEAIERSQK